jgi:hypothetical protein
MKSTLAMLLGALVGLSLVAWSLDTLVPQHTRGSVRTENLEARLPR